MLCKMYLVSPEYLKTITGNNSDTRLPPPPPKVARKAPGAGKKHGGKRRSVKNTKNKKGTVKREYDRWVTARATARREYDKWIKVRAKLHEANVDRKSQIKTVAYFLKQVLPASSPKLGGSHLGTQTELGPVTPAKRYIKSEPPATPAKHRIEYKTPPPIPSTSSDVIYEMPTPPLLPSIEKGDAEDDGDDVDPRI